MATASATSAPWLIALLILALVPAFLGEAHFNAQSYSLNYARTPERRELDYVRQTGASVETAKEVKIFGLNSFLIDRYRQLAGAIYEENRRLAARRAGWGGVLTALGTLGYYVAYAFIAWRTLDLGGSAAVAYMLLFLSTVFSVSFFNFIILPMRARRQ